MVKMTLGRKPEAIDYLERYVERGEKDTDRHPVGAMGTFNRETDIAWDPQDNMYVSDGYGNSRVVKISKDGVWLKAVGTYGNGQDSSTRRTASPSDGQGNVYVADRGNNRIQVYDNDLNFKKTITGIGAPWSVQVTPKYIYSGDGTGKIYQMDHTGKLLGWAQTGMGYGPDRLHHPRAPRRVRQRPLSRLLLGMERREDHHQISPSLYRYLIPALAAASALPFGTTRMTPIIPPSSCSRRWQ